MEFNVNNDDTVRRLLEIRSKELGETTKQSATAVIITALKSLRGDTKIAVPSHGKKITVKNVTTQYRPSFRTKDGNRRFCLMSGKGKNRVEVTKPKDWRFIFDKDALSLKSFYCEDVRASGKVYKYLIVTNNASKARQIANMLHDKRVNRRKQLAKYALGICMAKLAAGTGLPNVSDAVKKSSFSNSKVEVSDSGFNSGEVRIYVNDDLDYAQKALKNITPDQAMQKSVNQVAGLIIQHIKRNNKLDDSIKNSLTSELKSMIK